MEYFIAVFVYCVLIRLLYIIRKAMKALNHNYSLFDDVLLFSGIPVTFGYLLFMTFNPSNQKRFVSEVMDESMPILFPLLVWMVVSSMCFLWRNRKIKKLYWGGFNLSSFFNLLCLKKVLYSRTFENELKRRIFCLRMNEYVYVFLWVSEAYN